VFPDTRAYAIDWDYLTWTASLGIAVGE